MRVEQGVNILNSLEEYKHVPVGEYFIYETDFTLKRYLFKRTANDCIEVNINNLGTAIKIAKLLNQDNGGQDETNAK